MEENKNKKYIRLLAVFLILVMLASGTYAFITLTPNITNGTYNVGTSCFLIDYNSSTTASQSISGTLWPTANASGGLNGLVTLKINDSCANISGTGTLYLHINSGTSSVLTANVTGYCVNDYNNVIGNVTSQADCTSGTWVTGRCENSSTLETDHDKITSDSCTTSGYSWVTSKSALKYAVYNNSTASGTPLSSGYISSSDIGNDIEIYDGFEITSTLSSYYVYVWMDGYIINNNYANQTFSGYISASAVQDE